MDVITVTGADVFDQAAVQYLEDPSVPIVVQDNRGRFWKVEPTEAPQDDKERKS